VKRKLPSARSSQTTYGAPLETAYGDDERFARGCVVCRPSRRAAVHAWRAADMYRGRLWTMRQYAGSAPRRHQRALPLAPESTGRPVLSVAFDLPTQMGYDPDDPRVAGEVGKVGVSIATVRGMERLLRGDPAR